MMVSRHVCVGVGVATAYCKYNHTQREKERGRERERVISEKKKAYLKSAFSAPRICTVEAGYLARFVRLPA